VEPQALVMVNKSIRLFAHKAAVRQDQESPESKEFLLQPFVKFVFSYKLKIELVLIYQPQRQKTADNKIYFNWPIS
jgi:hypothetical protein